jgi:hypothetical protein
MKLFGLWITTDALQRRLIRAVRHEVEIRTIKTCADHVRQIYEDNHLAGHHNIDKRMALQVAEASLKQLYKDTQDQFTPPREPVIQE